VRVAIPTKSLGFLLIIGFTDLIVTAWLHAHGLIVELNPLMKGLIERSEWLFALVKGSTLIFTWVVLALYAREHREFVRKACLVGSLCYLIIWTTWFLGAM
jgi:hypothetical protein